MDETKLKPVVSILDPAIDHERAGWDVIRRYKEHREYDLIRQYIKPGEHPTVYHLRPLRQSVFSDKVEALLGQHARCAAAFRYGVARVEHMRTVDGRRVDWKPSTEHGMTDEELDRFWAYERDEIGSVVWHQSVLPPWIAGEYQLPPMSLGIAEQTLPRLVGQSQSDPQKSNEEHSASTKGTQNEADATGG